MLLKMNSEVSCMRDSVTIIEKLNYKHVIEKVRDGEYKVLVYKKKDNGKNEYEDIPCFGSYSLNAEEVKELCYGY